MKEMVYQTVCPGCNMGCGLYIREGDNDSLSVDFMKSSPVNLGKLCRFAMKLPHHYSKATCMVDGAKVSMEDAIKAASARLKGAGDVTGNTGVALLSVGNTTCEEHLAFSAIADALGTDVSTGMGIYSEIPSACYPTVCVDMPLGDIEKAKRIALFIDPYIQYPLLVRRLLEARRNGASIVSAGNRVLNLADENLNITPERYESELGLDSGSLIIADVHPSSDPEQVKQMLNLSLRTGARILFMKPFVNSTGVSLFSKGAAQKGLAEIMAGIDAGSIKTLVTLDSDPIELMPDSDAAAKTLRKLDNLIVITSRNGSVNSISSVTASVTASVPASVIIATEPQYTKAGSFMNVEGQLFSNSGSGTAGIDAMSAIAQNLGGKAVDYQSLHNKVLQGIVEKYTRPKYKELVCKVMGVAPTGEGTGNLLYVHNPFMWFDQADDNDFVMVSMNMVKKLRLKKGGMIALTSDNGSMRMRFRVEEMPDGLILTMKKLPVATGSITRVTAEAV